MISDPFLVLRAQAHEELDKCLDEARTGSLGWLNDPELRLQTDRVYSSVHAYGVAHARASAARDGDK